MLALQSAFGFIAICVIAWLLSEDRRAVPWRIVVAGALLQLALAALLLWVPLFRNLFLALNDLLSALEQATQEGTRFVFGFLGGGPHTVRRAAGHFKLRAGLWPRHANLPLTYHPVPDIA